MHYHCEIVMPKTDNIEAAIKTILAPFDEGKEEDYGSGAFWDWWVIGGRWSGIKLESKLDQDKLEEFRNKLIEMNITVSGFQCGKEEIRPASQESIVDNLWKEYFPDCGIAKCPMFKHSNSNQSIISGDIMDYDLVTDTLKISRIIFAGKDSAKFMLEDSYWNGVNYVDSKWNGDFKSAKEMHLKKLNMYAEEYKEKYTPMDNWVVVTIDYHS